MIDREYYVYIMASRKSGTLYVGMTNNLPRRVYEHKNNLVDGFTKKYGVHRLVWYERTVDVNSALLKEKQIKKWNRNWKIRMIEEKNAEWEDLSKDFM
ncbi:MAG: GIY-YIG nuclease family protein [Coriobacteriales bacterium]|jgi:putative endonuclease|nr:GIY-YIG nuclease family protein [Coriobacteriales bacterium]